MITSAIKKLFLSEFDEFQSAYVSNSKLNDFYYDAQTQVYKDQMSQYQLSNRITEDLIPLNRKITLNPGSSIINLDTDLTDYNQLITITPTWIIDGTSYSIVATELIAEDKISTYTKGSYRYPKYEQFSDGSAVKMLQIYPIDTPDTVEINYFRSPIPIDFDQPTVDIPYTDNMITVITVKARQIASAAFRDPESFSDSSQLLNQANSATQ